MSGSAAPADGVARLRECARGLDPDTVLAAARATAPEAIDPTARLTLRRVAAVLSERGAGAGQDTLLGCAGFGYLTGSLALGSGPRASETSAPEPARALRLLSCVRDYDLEVLDGALGAFAERAAEIVAELDDDATARTAFRLGLALAVAEDELRPGGGHA